MAALTIVAAGAGTGVMFMAALIGGTTGALTAAGGTAPGCATTDQPGVSRAADDIPAEYLRLYRATGSAYGIPWTVLAAIGHIETHHGRDQRVSGAGARGPMQFMPGTWATYGLDGDADGRADITDPADAIPAAARYLKASGAPARLREAIYAYNHSWTYVDNVIADARRYAAARPTEAADDTGCGYAGPVQAPTAIAAQVVAYARAQLGKPYVFGGTGPAGYDCSGLTMMAYRAAGIAIPRLSDAQYWFGAKVLPGQEAPGDLVFFDYQPGHSGPGHVGIVYDAQHGLMLVAPHTGVNVRVQSYRDYPGGPVGFTRPYARYR
jgi:cell wall-associated NlpC family hydrolase